MPELLGTPLFNDANLLEYWTLEDRLADKSTNDLTENGLPAYTPAKFSNGLNEGAVNVTIYLMTATTFIDGGAASIVCWVKLLSEIAASTWRLIQQKSPSDGTTSTITIEYQYNAGSPLLNFERGKPGVGSDSATYAITLGTANWYHLALTYDGTTVRGYVNGVEQASVASSGEGSGATTPGFSIGADTDGNRKASALIDDVAIFSDKLTAAEVLSLYQAGAPGRDLSLLHVG